MGLKRVKRLGSLKPGKNVRTILMGKKGQFLKGLIQNKRLQHL